jgi:hypothetical protein
MPENQASSGVVVMARLVWMFIGPLVLLGLAYAMASEQRGWLAAQSIAFIVILGLVVVCRWADPLTSDGEPTTREHLRRYALRTFLAGGFAWALANLAGNHLLVS